MAAIGVVADDFTGTASSGVLVAKTGAKTGLFFDSDSVEQFTEAQRLDAIYVSSNSRHMKPEEAYAEVAKTTEALQKLGAKYFSKKIDTTLRGGIGYEIDSMLDTLKEDMVAISVTAMPQSRRICVGGYSIIDGVILTETPVAKDVKSSVKEAYVPDLLKAQSKRPVGLIEIRDVTKGPEHIKLKVENLINEGKQLIVIDAISMEHVDSIACACVALSKKVLAVDPGPFTMKMSYYRGLIASEQEGAVERQVMSSDKVSLFVVGTANPATKKQIDYLCNHEPDCEVISVSPLALISENSLQEIENAAEKIVKLIKDKEKKIIIFETGIHGELVDLGKEDQERGHSIGWASSKINSGLAEITNLILENVERDRIAGLMMTGGDTMESVCRKIGVKCIQAVGNIVAQVDVGKIIGKYDGLPIVVKGGFCGSEEIGVEIVKRMRRESENN